MGGLGLGHVKRAQEYRTRRSERVASMEAMYRDGLTLQQIGDRFGITRERVRQLLRRDTTITAQVGGISVLGRRSKERALAKKNARALVRWGCTHEQHQSLLEIGKKMMAAGAGSDRTPTRAFHRQKQNARVRGIAWELSLWDWWQIWERSGKWEQRGRGQGYVMSRVGDKGAYALGNVWIITSAENVSCSPKIKKSTLPMGVHLVVRGAYRAYVSTRMLGGIRYHIGTFKTPELAHAAYLAFTPPAQVAA